MYFIWVNRGCRGFWLVIGPKVDVHVDKIIDVHAQTLEHRYNLLSFGFEAEALHTCYQGSKFHQNFTNFSNFGGGRNKNLQSCNTLIQVLYNTRLIFSIIYVAYSSTQ
jgi:hypothetical protein